MPKLNEYLGSIVSSITSARMMSDIQSVKVAEEYAKHHLLKHFAIPRMRIGDVELTIPVALDAFQETTETVYEPIDNRAFNSIVYRELVNSLGRASLPAKESQLLRSEIARQTRNLEEDIRITRNLEPLQNYSEKMLLAIEGVQKRINPESEQELNRSAIRKTLDERLSGQIKIQRTAKKLEDLNVMVESGKLREEKPENLIYIKMRINEDGMEWHNIETGDGQVDSKLLPE